MALTAVVVAEVKHHQSIHHGPAKVHHAPVHHAPVHHAPYTPPVVYTTPAPYTPAPYHPPTPTYKPVKPTYKPTPAPYHSPEKPSYHPEPKYQDHPVNYEYAYAVKDDYSGLHFGANEKRDGYSTNGQYHVALPDCQIQTVTYTVDGYGGYVADVSYSGEPCEPKYHAPALAYKPAAPSYHSTPVPTYAPAPYDLPTPFYKSATRVRPIRLFSYRPIPICTKTIPFVNRPI